MTLDQLLISKRPDEYDRSILKWLFDTIRNHPKFVPDIISYCGQLIQSANDDANREEKQHMYDVIARLESWSSINAYRDQDKKVVKDAIKSIYNDKYQQEKLEKWS